MKRKVREKKSPPVVSNSLRPHGLYSPWNSPGQNTGMGSLSLLQGIFLTQGSNPGLPLCRQILYQLSHTRKALYEKNYTHITLGFPGGSDGKESACNVGDLGLIPGLGRSPGERKGYPLQYSGLENSMDCIVRGVAKSQTRQSDFHFHYLLELAQTHVH